MNIHNRIYSRYLSVVLIRKFVISGLANRFRLSCFDEISQLEEIYAIIWVICDFDCKRAHEYICFSFASAINHNERISFIIFIISTLNRSNNVDFVAYAFRVASFYAYLLLSLPRPPFLLFLSPPSSLSIHLTRSLRRLSCSIQFSREPRLTRRLVILIIFGSLPHTYVLHNNYRMICNIFSLLLNKFVAICHITQCFSSRLLFSRQSTTQNSIMRHFFQANSRGVCSVARDKCSATQQKAALSMIFIFHIVSVKMF